MTHATDKAIDPSVGTDLDWGADPFWQLAQWAGHAATVLAEGQAGWLRGAEVWTEFLMRPWFGDLPATAVAAPTAFEPPGSTTPAGLLDAAFANWNAVGEIWVNALRHDIGAAPAPRAGSDAR